MRGGFVGGKVDGLYHEERRRRQGKRGEQHKPGDKPRRYYRNGPRRPPRSTVWFAISAGASPRTRAGSATPAKASGGLATNAAPATAAPWVPIRPGSPSGRAAPGSTSQPRLLGWLAS